MHHCWKKLGFNEEGKELLVRNLQMKNVEVMLEMYEIERNENKKVKLVE